jgi:hypothetical protein
LPATTWWIMRRRSSPRRRTHRRTRGRLTFVLLKALGQAVIVNDVEPEKVRNFLARKRG